MGSAYGRRQCPRQNGKSLLVQGRSEAGMLLFNETVIYTAHLQKTATETFEEMRAFLKAQSCAVMWPRSKRRWAGSRSS